MNLGKHDYYQEAFDESLALLLEARTLDKLHSLTERKKVRLLVGVIYYQKRSYSKSESALLEALRLGDNQDQDPYILYVLARTYERWGRRYRAGKIYKQIIEEYPNHPVAPKAWDGHMGLEGRGRR
jgi:tetratricopeptide (TPR) repeat protein